ncbi:MAG: carboxypeptidase regulatory-like domain-containing protein [Candidatus Eisenbacteria bacterium]|nr:carboxypeptidase regulatory-like domain-containing protein [Candidatus Eisenbacteria bacterium]
MDFLRVYWPSLIGLLLVLLHLGVLLGRSGGRTTEGRGSDHGDRVFSILVSLLLLILLSGAQVANRNAFRALAERERRSDGAEEALQRANQEWSLRLARAEGERDSLHAALDAIEEGAREKFHFEGLVLNEEDGGPIRGARISLFRRAGGRTGRERAVARDLLTDGEGRFRAEISRLRSGEALRLEVTAAGFAPAKEWVPPSLPEGPVTIRMRP